MQKKANAWGLHDMHGNVSEWCFDRYGRYPGGAVTDPSGPGMGTDSVIRGGCWFDKKAGCSTSGRNYKPYEYYRLNFIGFRLALAPVLTK
jgi:formylglycine-generating enzyme required for sulfatase activity